MVGGVGLTSCMMIIGSLYASHSVHPYGSARWVVITLVFVFGLTYAATWGIAGKVYASEIQPSNTRAAANCIAQGLSFVSQEDKNIQSFQSSADNDKFTNWLVAISTPIFLANSSFGAYFLFGSLSLITLVVLFIYMPETRGRSLESIQETFARPVARSWAHHIRRLFSSSASPASVTSGESTTELADLDHAGMTASSALDGRLPLGGLRMESSTV